MCRNESKLTQNILCEKSTQCEREKSQVNSEKTSTISNMCTTILSILCPNIKITIISITLLKVYVSHS